jgi:tRNA 2-thiouridine synthesizing protein C
MSTATLIHITTPPTPDCEALEYALALAAFDLDVAILFTGDGLFWLQENQAARVSGGKNPSKLLAALPLFGIEEVGYCLSKDEADDLPLTAGATLINQDTRQQWLASAKHIVSF